MRDTSNKILRNAQTFSVIALLIVVALVLVWLAVAFAELDKEVKVPIIAGLFALLAVAFTYIRENNLKRQEAHRSKKIEIYSLFFDMIGRMTLDVHSGSATSFTESSTFVSQMLVLKNNLLFYGSPKVIKTFNEFQNKSGNSATSLEVIDRVGNLLLAMRKDVGLSNFGLDARELNQIIVKEDVRELVRQGTAK